MRREVGAVVEHGGSAREVFLRGRGRIREGGTLGGTGERIERHEDGLARTAERLPGFGERRIGRQVVDDRVMGRRAADAFGLGVIEFLVLTDVVLVQAQEGHGVLDAELAVDDGAVRELFRIVVFDAREELPGEDVAVGVPAFVANGFLSHDLAPVEDRVLGVMAAVLDGALDLLGLDLPGFLVVQVNLVHEEVVRDVDDFVVVNLAGDPAVALMDGELPGFVRIGDRVGAAVVEVAEFGEELRGDFNAFTGGMGAFGDEAADAVADAAVLDFHAVGVEDLAAPVRGDHDAGVVEEAVGEARAVRNEGLRPVEAQRLLDLRDFGRELLELQHFTLLVLGGRNVVLHVEETTAVVFVVGDDDVARFGNGLADHERAAGLGRADGGKQRGNGDQRLLEHFRTPLS